MASDNIDYRKLLKKCIKYLLIENMGCWDLDYEKDLSELEKNAARDVIEEAKKEEIKREQKAVKNLNKEK